MFNSTIIKHFSNPQNLGELENPDHEINVGNPVCDDRVMMQIKFDTHGRIADVKYRVYGCATSIATASIFSEFIKSKSLDEIAIQFSQVKDDLLGELEPNQFHCKDILGKLIDGIIKQKV